MQATELLVHLVHQKNKSSFMHQANSRKDSIIYMYVGKEIRINSLLPICITATALPTLHLPSYLYPFAFLSHSHCYSP